MWWDRSILPGESFDDAIERAIADARCLVVLWSNHSVQSRWVRNEASEGERRGILVPALLEEAPIPLQFRSLQAADLRNWDVVSPHNELETLTKAIQQSISRSTGTRHEAPFKTEPSPPTSLPKAEPTESAEIRSSSIQDDRAFDRSRQGSPQQQTSLLGMGLVAVPIVGVLLATLLFVNFKSPSPGSTTNWTQSNSTELATGAMPSTTASQSAPAENPTVRADPSPTPVSPPKARPSSGTAPHGEHARESTKTTVAARSPNPVQAPPKIDQQLATRSSINNGTGYRASSPPASLDIRNSDLYKMFLLDYGNLKGEAIISGDFELVRKERKAHGHQSFSEGQPKGGVRIVSSDEGVPLLFCSTRSLAESGKYFSDIGNFRYENGQWNVYDFKEDGSESKVTGDEVKTNGELLAWYRRGPDFEEFTVWKRKTITDSELRLKLAQAYVETLRRWAKNLKLPPGSDPMSFARNTRA